MKMLKSVHRFRHGIQEKTNEKNRLLFYSGFLKSGDLVFDVGANVGNRVCSFLTIGCQVVAVEPQQECYEVLEKKFGDNIQIVKSGLGADEEEKVMYIANESTISSFSEEWINSVKENRFSRFNWDRQVTIQLTTLDKLIAQYGKPVFCKIDVEGYEAEVLKGLSQPLNAISLEYTVPEQTNRLVECIHLCMKLEPSYKYNYAVGESMQFRLPESLPAAAFLEHIHSTPFQLTGFGDIYVMQ